MNPLQLAADTGNLSRLPPELLAMTGWYLSELVSELNRPFSEEEAEWLLSSTGRHISIIYLSAESKGCLLEMHTVCRGKEVLTSRSFAGGACEDKAFYRDFGGTGLEGGVSKQDLVTHLIDRLGPDIKNQIKVESETVMFTGEVILLDVRSMFLLFQRRCPEFAKKRTQMFFSSVVVYLNDRDVVLEMYAIGSLWDGGKVDSGKNSTEYCRRIREELS